jgi:hypothetical protein
MPRATPRATSNKNNTPKLVPAAETENLLLLDDIELTDKAQATDPEPLEQQDVDAIVDAAAPELVVSEVVSSVNPCQQAMLAIAKQNEYRDTKAVDEVTARQARFDLDNQMAQDLAAIPQRIASHRAALRNARKPKPLQEPEPTQHPAKGVVVDLDALPVETNDQEPDQTQNQVR